MALSMDEFREDLLLRYNPCDVVPLLMSCPIRCLTVFTDPIDANLSNTMPVEMPCSSCEGRRLPQQPLLSPQIDLLRRHRPNHTERSKDTSHVLQDSPRSRCGPRVSLRHPGLVFLAVFQSRLPLCQV